MMNKPGKDVDKRERIVKRIARELRDGYWQAGETLGECAVVLAGQ